MHNTGFILDNVTTDYPVYNDDDEWWMMNDIIITITIYDMHKSSVSKNAFTWLKNRKNMTIN
jgi:hypothetical protein